MVIERVEIRRYGKLAGFCADFDPAFNLIEGPNESGKSTLASFLFYMLYGFFDGEPTGTLSERALRTSWDTEEIGGSLFLSENGRRYRIDRTSTLTEKGKRDYCAVTDLESGEKTEDQSAPGERFLGVSREVFENTAFFDGADGYLVDGDKMTDAIENIVFSGSAKLSIVKAMMKLKEVRAQLISPSGKSGALLSLEKEKDALRERLARAKEREEELLRKENLLHTTREKRKECMRELAKFHRLETDYHNAVMIRDYDRLHELEDVVAEKERVIASYENEHRTGSFLPSVAYLTELSTAKVQMDGAAANLKEREATLEKIEKEGSPVTDEERAALARLRAGGDEATLRERASTNDKTAKKQLVFFILCFALSLALLVLSVVSVALSRTALSLVLAALALVGLGAGIVLTFEFRRTRAVLLSVYDLGCVTSADAFEACLSDAAEAERRELAYQAALEAAKGAYENAQADKNAKAKVLEIAIRRLHPDVTLDESYEQEVEQLSKEVEEYVAHASELYREKEAAEAEVRALRARLAGQNEIAVRALVPPDKRAELCNHNASDLRHGVEHYEKMLESFTEKEETLEKLLAEMEDSEGSAEVVEQMMVLESRMRKMREQASLYSSAEEKLHGSLNRLRTEVSPRLSLYACGLLDELTDGKYSELRIGDDLSLSVLCEEGEHSVSYLSHGTKQMTYLALRMALLDLLYTAKPPVCLDESLAHQDDERAASFMRTLAGISAMGTQCFLFTSHGREKSLARNIFGSYGLITLTE